MTELPSFGKVERISRLVGPSKHVPWSGEAWPIWVLQRIQRRQRKAARR